MALRMKWPVRPEEHQGRMLRLNHGWLHLADNYSVGQNHVGEDNTYHVTDDEPEWAIPRGGAADIDLYDLGMKHPAETLDWRISTNHQLNEFEQSTASLHHQAMETAHLDGADNMMTSRKAFFQRASEELESHGEMKLGRRSGRAEPAGIRGGRDAMSDEKTMAQAFLDKNLESWEEDGQTVHDWRHPEIFTDPGEMNHAGGIVLADPSTDSDESPLILAAFQDGSWFLEDRRGQGQPRVYNRHARRLLENHRRPDRHHPGGPGNAGGCPVAPRRPAAWNTARTKPLRAPGPHAPNRTPQSVDAAPTQVRPGPSM